ncbi:DsrE/DsrF/DrsH-like family protein [Myroides sp. 1354]|uniref:DsrE/DsrF/DrsH-like family protein n=1 Tax=unclassified Myroides TaxID=2642485 RepID=UPI002577091A|nr:MULTISPECIES: DsrE/DsrF/DrsH-like family protein [unclassified Myroides]MDM1046222.1 DsrE/DsrF/DrsH-like family protein [Myroides sp. R163-1]MDM1057158.1 DsrE/DsrF/DrsH-like family protein [Myroides sp. 1354]MDM1070353.1 DsrE/DsrF/DrsH-like family protein [Myroides sp. 1372]
MKRMLWAIAVLLGTTTMINATNLTHTVNAAVLQVTTGDKYAILVQSTKNLRASIMTASEMKKDNPAIAFEIVIMGQMVQELNDSELRSTLDAANKAGVKLVVCEFALQVYGVQLKDLPSYFVGTPNAHKYMFQLNERKYNTLSI